MIIHINLISHQLLPNVIGTLSNSLENMKIVLVLGDNKLKEKAELLTDFYRKKGIKSVETINCQTSTEHAKIFARAEALYEQIRYEYPDAMIAVNATGGTKPMSIAFTQVFDRLNQNSMAFYTDTIEKRHIILTDPRENKVEPLPYHSVLNIDESLYLNQFVVNSEINTHSRDHDDILERRNLTEYLLAISKREPNLISLLNKLAQHTHFGSQKFSPKLSGSDVPHFSAIKKCYQALEQANLVNFNSDENSLIFSSKVLLDMLAEHGLKNLLI